ncbi:MAG: Transposase [Nitrospira sp.]|nr:MAG: Transposase [Nitrospira sp.]WHZ26251.1 MAG: Transposase [Nitrospira sp.]WHZ26306.1 MAG: Transposase [Nitrospira sp.]WHZ26426.1 MAG: Transposase [Nitrospira sp.]WHZ27403.1 MAG: Transposase [Nitrospira sp.]
MMRATVLQEVRRMRFEELYARRHRGELTMAEAAELLGVTERTFRRWSVRYETEGVEGLEDRRLGRASARAVPVDEALRMVTLYETQYRGWTVKHFHERWHQEHGGTRSYTWTKNRLQRAGHVTRASRRGAHRKKRPRKPLPGMMLHQDGSRHEWVPGCQWDLIVTLDDATSEMYSAFFVEEEGTMSSFRGLREVIEKQGLFSSLYTDRGSHYWYTEKTGGKVDKTRLTQVHRALRQLGITLIAAYSPEARGRSERVFRTLQDRLPKELALARITTIAAANRYLTEQFLPAYNRRFAVPAVEAGTAFVPWIGSNLAEILCVQDERVVANDNTVRYQGQHLQIPPDQHRFHYVKTTVRVHAYPDSTLAVFHGPRCLARYQPDGRVIESKDAPSSRRGPTRRSGGRPIVDPRPIVRENISAHG